MTSFSEQSGHQEPGSQYPLKAGCRWEPGGILTLVYRVLWVKMLMSRL